MDNLEENQNIKDIIEKVKERSNNNIVVKSKSINGFVEHNSFLEPITSEMCRTSKSVPTKGYTSVSRIAKG